MSFPCLRSWFAPRRLDAALLSGLVRLSAPALTQPSGAGLRLYVLDCGTVVYNNPEAYHLTRQEVRNTNMSVACYLVVHPSGTMLFDAGLPDETLGRPFNESPLSGEANPPSTAYFMLVENAREPAGRDRDPGGEDRLPRALPLPPRPRGQRQRLRLLHLAGTEG